MESIRVTVRVRPFMKREIDSKSANIIIVDDNVLSVCNSKDNRGYRQPAANELTNHFRFDKIYVDTEKSSISSLIGEDVGRGVVQCALNSYNTSVIVFGQKGSGKTFTVIGKESKEPILSLNDGGLLQHISEKLFSSSNVCSEAICTTQLSCLEIYDNQLIDLLRDGRSSFLSGLHIREDSKMGPFVEGLAKHRVTSHEQLLTVLHNSLMRRKVQTWDQYKSSRSHVIISIQHTQASFVDSVPNEVTSKIDIVDVADRITDQGCNIRLNKSESDRLNRCLMAFHDVIKALADGVDRRGTRRKSIYVPFRDSLLTWIMKDSVGGNNATFMIATINPSDQSCTETLHTLQTASRSRRIINRPSTNTDPHVIRLKDLWEDNRRLRSSLADNARPRLLTPMKHFVDIREKLAKNQERIHDLIGNWIDKWEAIAAIISPSSKELVRMWKENQSTWIGSCGTDSAFGSDLETDMDSKSNAYDSDRSNDRRSPRVRSCLLSPDDSSSVWFGCLKRASSSSSVFVDSTPDKETPPPPPQHQHQPQPPQSPQPHNWMTSRRVQPKYKRQSSDTLRIYIKGSEQSNSCFKPVARNVPVVSLRTEPLTLENIQLTVISRAQDKLSATAVGPSGERCGTRRERTPKNVLFGPSSQTLQPTTSRTFLCPARPVVEAPTDMTSLFSLLSKEFVLIQDRMTELFNHQQSSAISLRKVTTGLMNDVTIRLSTVTYLMKKLKEMKASCKDLDDFNARWKHNDQLMISLESIFKINQLIRNVENNVQIQRYQDVAANLEEARVLISALSMEENFEQKASKVLRTELCLVRQRVVCQVVETWDRLVKWHIPPRTILQGARPATVSLDLSLLYWQNEISAPLAQTLEDLDLLNAQIESFCELLLVHFIQKLASNRGTLLQIVDEADRYMVHITTRSSQRTSTSTDVPTEVLRKIEQIFHFLDRPMSKIKVRTIESKETTMMERIGRVISKRLFDAIYNECLSRSLQKAGVQWVTYDQIAKATEMFQEAMTKLKLLTADQAPLSAYLNTIASHFGQVKSQELLKQAHDFVTSDLADFQQISVDHPLGKPTKKNSIEREEFVKHCKEKVRTANYKLPTCQISNPVRSLVCMAYDTLKDASTGSRQGATQLCGSVHSMFELYCDMIPFHHQDKIRTIPLLAALHHNNCMFVAHHLITIEKVFRRELLPIPASSSSSSPSSSPPSSSSSSNQTAIEEAQKKSQLGLLVSKIRRLGNEGFGEHVELKQKEVCDDLNDAKGFSCISDDEDALTAVREMMHHLKQISLIWRNVLPANIYCRAIGSLLNSALKDVIDSVTGIEEFSMDDCLHLQKVLTFIQTSVSDLFPQDISKTRSVEVTIQENVANWMKFKELVLFFGFSLVDIADHWACGKGPLALHFTSAEVMQMVVAMFENTSRRNALLTELRKNPSIHQN